MKVHQPPNLQWMVERCMTQDELNLLFKAAPVHDEVHQQIDAVDVEIYLMTIEANNEKVYL